MFASVLNILMTQHYSVYYLCECAYSQKHEYTKDLSHRDVIVKVKMDHESKRLGTAMDKDRQMRITHILSFVPFLVHLPTS